MFGNGLALVLTEGTGKSALVKLLLEYILTPQTNPQTLGQAQSM